MAILDIENRTENWRTARVLAPLVEKPSARVALAKHLVGSADQCGGCGDSIEFELFWKGMRDYIHECQDQRKEDNAAKFVALYSKHFGKLRQKVEHYTGLQTPKCHNYVASDDSEEELHSNLFNTEVDIVLQTTMHLCIGEAKRQEAFGSNSDYVLVHQLIRQLVMARILIELKGGDIQVVPFVIGDCRESLMRRHQVKFMIKERYLCERNVLSWEDLSTIIKG